MEVADHLGEQEKGAAHHDQADGEADEVLQLADAVSKTLAGCLAQGQDGEVGGEDGEKIGALLEQVAEDGERIGKPGCAGHEQDIRGAEGHAKEEILFTGAGGGGVHGRGWNGELKSG